MGEMTIRGIPEQQKLREWSQRVAEYRSSGLSVTQWCAEHELKPKTYYRQKKVLMAQRTQEKAPQARKRKFAELPTPAVQKELVATVRFGETSLEIYGGAGAEVVAALCKVLSNVK